MSPINPLTIHTHKDTHMQVTCAHIHLCNAVANAIITAHQAKPTCGNVVVCARRMEAKSWFYAQITPKMLQNKKKSILEMSFKFKQGWYKRTHPVLRLFAAAAAAAASLRGAPVHRFLSTIMAATQIKLCGVCVHVCVRK